MNRFVSLRVLKVSAACALIFTFMLAAAGCLNMMPAYSMSDATTVDNILYCTKKDDNSESVVIGSWWDGETTEIVYEIPDTFEGRSVTWLGDKITGFEISDDNPVYYSRDGVPYLKSNDEKVDCAGFVG